MSANTFSARKQNISANTFSDRQPPYIKHDQRAINALRTRNGEKYHALAARIESCYSRKVCSSPYCIPCRTRMANAAKQRMLDYVSTEFGGLEHTADSRRRLRFGTLIADLVPVNWDAVENAMASESVRLDKLRRDFPSIWFQGAFELELVNCERLFELPGNNQKRATLKALLGGRVPDPMMILVHSHGLYDLKGIPQDRFYNRVYHHYDEAPKQAYFSKTHADQVALEDMCWKMGSYLFKSRVQFNMTFESQGYRDETYFSDYDLSNLVMIYSSVMFNGPMNRGNKSLLIGANGR